MLMFFQSIWQRWISVGKRDGSAVGIVGWLREEFFKHHSTESSVENSLEMPLLWSGGIPWKQCACHCLLSLCEFWVCVSVHMGSLMPQILGQCPGS